VIWKRKRPREAAGVVIYVDSIEYSYHIVKWNYGVVAWDISLLRSSAGVRTVTQPLRAGLSYATPPALVCGYDRASELVMGELRSHVEHSFQGVTLGRWVGVTSATLQRRIGPRPCSRLDSSMFCPECKAEYRPGFTRCSDCDVDLVEAISPADRTNELTYGSLGTIKRVWSGKDEERCVTLCERLKVAGIPFQVDQRRHQYLLRIDEHYVIGVPTEFFDDARKTIKAV